PAVTGVVGRRREATRGELAAILDFRSNERKVSRTRRKCSRPKNGRGGDQDRRPVTILSSTGSAVSAAYLSWPLAPEAAVDVADDAERALVDSPRSSPFWAAGAEGQDHQSTGSGGPDATRREARELSLPTTTSGD